jgi:hypothetical protein
VLLKGQSDTALDASTLQLYSQSQELGGVTPTGEVVGLTRAGVAALLHISSWTVRRLEERGELHPRVIDGVHFFDPEEIQGVVLILPGAGGAAASAA